jgi:hypothetical protein
MPYICPVCGFPNLTERPHSDGNGGSYEICPSCAFQFGVSDEDLEFSYNEWRNEWIKDGRPWRSIGIAQPKDWEPKV